MGITPAPPDPAALNRQFTATLRSNRTARLVLTGIIAVVVAGSIVLLWLVVMTQQRQLRADSGQLNAAATQLARDTTALARDTETIRRAQLSACQFNRDLSPLAGLQSKALILLISDSRRSFLTRRCPGTLPSPDPTYVQWARFYHVPVVR